MRVRLLGEDASRLAAARLAARRHARPGGDSNEIVRVHNLARTQYVRDSRTGVWTDRLGEVLKGALDPFLLAYLRTVNP